MFKYLNAVFLAILIVAVTPVSTVQATLIVDIKPIQICSDDGSDCAGIGFFEAETDKIWSQAGIDMNFLSTTQINETDWLDVDVGNPLEQEAKDVMIYGRDNINDPDSTLAINMFFVESLDNSSGFYGLGCGAAIYAGYCDGLVGIFISEFIFDFNNGIGRLDTIAHEIGHVLGLTHDGFGAGFADNLMTSGSSRTAPDSIDNINPDGDMLSKLTEAQIAEVMNSDFVQTVPEPAPLGLMLLGFMSLIVVHRINHNC